METDQEQPEVPFPKNLVVHPAAHFREPVVKGSEECKKNSSHDNVMKMRDHKIGSAELPIEDLNAGWNANSHRGDHEEAVCVRTDPDCEHVMSPHTQAHEADTDRRRHHYRIPKYRFAREHRDNFRQESECGNNQDVHLRVPKNPEEVHPKNGRPSRLCVKVVPAEITINGKHHLSCSERRYGQKNHSTHH